MSFMWCQTHRWTIADLLFQVICWNAIEISLKVDLNRKKFAIFVKITKRKNGIKNIFVRMVSIWMRRKTFLVPIQRSSKNYVCNCGVWYSKSSNFSFVSVWLWNFKSNGWCWIILLIKYLLPDSGSYCVSISFAMLGIKMPMWWILLPWCWALWLLTCSFLKLLSIFFSLSARFRSLSKARLLNLLISARNSLRIIIS